MPVFKATSSCPSLLETFKNIVEHNSSNSVFQAVTECYYYGYNDYKLSRLISTSPQETATCRR